MTVLSRFSLEGKVAIVTGGAGRLTRQIIQALAEAGARVYGADIDLAAMSRLASELTRLGLKVFPAELDQGNETSIFALRQELLRNEQHIDVLVNAAVNRAMESWQDPAERFAESMRTNATGLFMIIRAIGDAMAEQGSGSIINIASIQGMLGPDGSLYDDLDFHGFIPDYFFHKGGMINFTRFVASHYGRYNVRCNCASPGGVQTADLSEEFVRRYSSRTMLGRMAQPVDLTGLIVFLASDASLYLTGANIPIDGGYTAK